MRCEASLALVYTVKLFDRLVARPVSLRIRSSSRGKRRVDTICDSPGTHSLRSFRQRMEHKSGTIVDSPFFHPQPKTVHEKVGDNQLLEYSVVVVLLIARFAQTLTGSSYISTYILAFQSIFFVYY